VPIQSYRDLEVWKTGMDLAEKSYRLARTLPREELFALSQQIRKAAVSVPANVAEGYGRDSTGDYVHFLRIAQGSLKELETHLLLGMRLGLLNPASCDPVLVIAESEGKMLRALIRSLAKG
jgi:four helix bundle protein